MNNFSSDFITLIRSASGLAQLVLFLLFALSILSWGIILEKLRTFYRAKKARRKILEINLDKLEPEELRRKLDLYPHSPITRVYQKIYSDYYRSHLQSGDEDTLTRLLQRQGAAENARLEARLGILASVGSVSPFIGLFGTVWGVMGAFMNIGTWGSTSIAVVAPGIAEALIATAAGLAAAIPAVLAYNAFVSALREESRGLEQFSSDLILAERARQKRRTAGGVPG
jgi:biopolymer transport protein TolQ